MSRLPRSFAEALEGISSPDGGAAAVAHGISALLDAERRCGDLARAVESFREAARVVGILEESRNGQRIYDAWCKLSRFFLEPLDALKHEVVGDPAEVAPAPVGFETVASLWEKTGPEIVALLEEHRALDRTLQESPTTAHVGYRVRSKLLLLDRRAERVKVALDLFRADLSRAARSGAVRLEGMLGLEAAGGGAS